MRKILLLLAIISIPLLSAYAGEKGNGGDAVVCRNDKNEILSAELLDFYESRVLRSTIVNLGSESEDYTVKVNTLIDQLGLISPSRANLYRGWYDTFDSEKLLLNGIELVDIPDSLHVAFPVGCKVEQVVIQQEPKYSEEKRYIFNNTIWTKLNNSSKAGLIFHELLFREAILTHDRFGIKEPLNSIDVRYLTALVASNKTADFNLKKWNDLIQSFDFFRYFEIDGLNKLIDSNTASLVYNDLGSSVKEWSACCNYNESPTLNFQSAPLSYFNIELNEDILNTRLILKKNMESVSATFDQDHSEFSYKFEKGKFKLKPAWRQNNTNLVNQIVIKNNGDFSTFLNQKDLHDTYFYTDPFQTLAPNCRTWEIKPGFWSTCGAECGGSIEVSMDFSASKNLVEKITIKRSGGAVVCGITFPDKPISLNFAEHGGLTGESPVPYYFASTFSLDEASLNSRFHATPNTRIDVIGQSIRAKSGTTLTRSVTEKNFSFTTDEPFSICKNSNCRRGCQFYPSGSLVTLKDQTQGTVCR